MSTLRVQLPWQRSGPGVGTTRRNSYVNSALFLQPQEEDSGDEQEDGQQFRQEEPTLLRSVTNPQPVGGQARHGASGGGGAREGDLDVMSATSSASGDVHASGSTASQNERRAQIDSCWCNIPDMFVDPAGRTAYYWMALVTVAVVYNWIVIILRVAFEDMRENEVHKVFRALDVVSDVIYLMDIIIQSRTAFLEDGCLITTLPETVREYRNQPRFVLDVLCVVPLALVTSYLSKICPLLPFQQGSTEIASPGLRVLRLLKYPAMNRFFEKTDSRTNNPNLLRAFKLSLHLWLVIHWIGCFYYLLSRFEGLGSNDWVYPNSTEYSAFSRKYIFCMYWSTMTLTTIGERPWPVTDVEYIFTGMTFLIGVFVFAAVVGNVGDVISNMNAARHDFQARMDQIKFYLNHRHVPEHLQDQIKRWAEYTWVRTKAINEHSMLQLLPNRLRTEVAIHVHLETLKKVRIFEQCEEGLLRELVLKLRPSIYSPGEYICRIGEIGREMYIIDHGKVEILFPEKKSGQKKQVAIMMPGNYFGEISLLKLDEGQNKRTADVRSIGFSELLCLSRRDLMAALMEYPEAKRILETQARQRMQQTKLTSGQGVGVRSCPDSSDSSHLLGSDSGSGSGASTGAARRSAKSIFAEVMKQEGFSKLLSSKANQELTEMRQILVELKEIKSHLFETTVKQLAQHCNTLEEQLKQKELELQQTRSQLQLHSQGLSSIASSTILNDMLVSPPMSSIWSPPSGLSSASILCSPARAQRLPSPGARCAQSAPARLKEADEAAVQVLPPLHGPAEASEHKRRRLSPASRTRQSAEEDPFAVDTFNRAGGELVQDVDGVFGVAQGGGGDELAVTAVPKDLEHAAEKEETRNEGEPQQTWTNCSDSGSCAADPSSTLAPADICPSTDSAVGRPSSHESFAPSSLEPQEGPIDCKPAAVGARPLQPTTLAVSDSFKSLASESYTSSQYTSYTDTSSMSSSSGGRGHSPKPAKPKHRYKAEMMSEGDTQPGDGGAEGKDAKEKCVPVELGAHNTLAASGGGDVFASNEGCPAISTVSTLRGTDSFISPGPADDSDDQCANSQSRQQALEVPGESGNTLAVCRSATASGEKLAESEKDGSSAGQTFSGADSLPEGQQYHKDPTMLEAVSMCREFFPNTEDDHDSLDREVDDADDGSDVDGAHFIPATRVKGTFDNSLPKEQQQNMPKPVTCRKIDDTQLSILLAMRREVNDKADYIVESPARPAVPEDKPSTEAIARADHGHSINTVMEHSDLAKEVNKLELTPPKPEDFGLDPEKNDPSSIHSADTELARAEEENGVKSDVPSTDAVCSSKRVLQGDSEHEGSLGSSITEQLTPAEDKKQSLDGMDHGERVPSDLHVNTEKGKTSPISILKKSTFELELEKQEHNSDQEGQKSSSLEGTALKVDENISASDGIGACPKKSKSALDRCVSLKKGAQNCKPQCTLKENDMDYSLTECDSSLCGANTKVPENKKLKRRRRGGLNTVAQTASFPLRRRDEGDQTPSDYAETAGTESASQGGSSNMSTCDQNPVHQDTSSDAAQKAPEEENEDENLGRLRRRYSASQYRRQNLDHTQASADTSDHVTALCSPKPFIRKVVSCPTTPQSGQATSGSSSPSAGKHSEKLDTLIAAFESPKKRNVREDFVCDGKVVTPKESTEKSKANDSSGDKKSPVLAAASPKSPSTDKKGDPKESRKDGSFSRTSSPCNSPSQKQKTLRRKSLTKHLPTPCGRKDSPSSDKSKTQCAKEGNEMTVSPQREESKKDLDAACQESPGGSTTRSTSRAQTSVSEKDVNKKPTSAGPCGEARHNCKGDERADTCLSVELDGAMTSVESTSSLVGDSELQSYSDRGHWSASHAHPVDGSLSLTPIDSRSLKSARDECKAGSRTKLSDSVRPKDDTMLWEHRVIATSSEGQAAAPRENSPSVARQLSFRDKIQQAARRFGSGETLDRANNSIASPSGTLESSSPSPPQNCNIIKSERSSYDPAKPMLPPTAISGDIMSDYVDQAMFLAPDLRRRNGPPPLYMSISVDAATESLDRCCPPLVPRRNVRETLTTEPLSPASVGSQQVCVPMKKRWQLRNARSLIPSSKGAFEDFSSRERPERQCLRSGDAARRTVNRSGADLGAAVKTDHPATIRLRNVRDSTACRPAGVGPEDLSSPSRNPMLNNGQQPPTVEIMQDILQLENALDHLRVENDPSLPGVENTQKLLHVEGNTHRHLLEEAEKTNERPRVRRESIGGSYPCLTDTGGSQEEGGLFERMVGMTMMETLHYYPSLLQSVGTSSTDDSAGEGEAEAGDRSFILLADFGVEDEDGEAGLTDLSECGEHSDINSDLDEL